MTGAFWVDNLAVYSLQVLIVVSVGAILALVVPLRTPRARLIYWQSLLAVCLLLPLLQVWETAPLVEVVRVNYEPGQTSGGTAPMGHAPRDWDLSGWVWGVLLAGTALRLTWLALGMLRLRRYRLESRPLDPLPADIAELREQLGAKCELRLSEHPRGPVMFGLVRPVILLPERFVELDADLQTSIAFHELLHVKRLDWGFTFAEELVRAALWFHPAVWWLINRIQLSREQAVDREVLVRTGKRESYIAALLAMSGAQAQLDLAPAQLFLRGRHLDMRVASILEEITMSSKALLFRICIITSAVAATTWLTVGHFPLHAAPEPQAEPNPSHPVGEMFVVPLDAAGVKVPSVSIEGAGNVRHRSAPLYPRSAIEAGVQGVVTLQVDVDAKGNAFDARVISGPSELRAEALRSVLQWHFADSGQPSQRVVSMNFQLSVQDQAGVPPNYDSSGPRTLGTVDAIEITGLPDDRKGALLGGMPIHVGDTLDSDQFVKVARYVKDFDEHLRASLFPPPAKDGDGRLTVRIFLPGDQVVPGVSQPPKTIRVGGAVQAARLVDSVPPRYPPLAKQARIQGIVEMQVLISQEGTVKKLELRSGHPLLVPAAIEAVKQWRYKVTKLNDQPVEVTTNVEVNFSLP